jgi:putative membrane protein
MKVFSKGNFPQPVLKPNDKKARRYIWAVSILVFVGIAFLSRVKLNINLGFDPHDFARANAIINSLVAILLVSALIAVKSKNYDWHRKFMLAAIVLSVLFLISYVCHHLTTGDTKFGDINGDGILSLDEKNIVGSIRYVYYFILLTHIPLAGIILPFILFTAYRALSGKYEQHKKLARITWPVWLYVAISGVVVYWMISPYYHV